MALDAAAVAFLHLAEIADVRGEGRGAPPASRFLGRRLGRVDLAGNDKHPRAVAGEDAGDALADALARAGDEHRLAVKRCEHAIIAPR